MFSICLVFSPLLQYWPDEVDVDGRSGETKLAKGEVCEVSVVEDRHLSRPESHVLTDLWKSESEGNLFWILDFHLQLVLQAELVFELSDMDSNHTESENVNILGLIII